MSGKPNARSPGPACAALLVVALATAPAVDVQDVSWTRSASMAGADFALTRGVAAVELNPANIFVEDSVAFSFSSTLHAGRVLVAGPGLRQLADIATASRPACTTPGNSCACAAVSHSRKAAPGRSHSASPWSEVSPSTSAVDGPREAETSEACRGCPSLSELASYSLNWAPDEALAARKYPGPALEDRPDRSVHVLQFGDGLRVRLGHQAHHDRSRESSRKSRDHLV